MKVEKSVFSEMLVLVYQNIRRYIPKTIVSILWTYIQGNSIKISLWNSSCCVKCQFWYMRCRQPQKKTCISSIIVCYMFRSCEPADGTRQSTKQSPLIFKIFCTMTRKLVHRRIINLLHLSIARRWQPVHVGVCCKSLASHMLFKGAKELKKITGLEIVTVGRMVHNLPVAPVTGSQYSTQWFLSVWTPSEAPGW
jgi:hypothetical protein